MEYRVPVAGDSGKDLPALLGLQSLARQNFILEMAPGNEHLTLPGPGGYTINWSPGTIRYKLEQSPSGHLILPCDEFLKVSKTHGGVKEPMMTFFGTKPVTKKTREIGARTDLAEEPMRKQVNNQKQKTSGRCPAGGNGSSSTGLILMTEAEHLISQILLDLGYSVLRLRYHECVKGQGKDVPRQIRNGNLAGICIHYYEWKKRIPVEMIDKFHKEVSVWLRHANQVGLPVLVVGLTGKHWDQTIWDEALGKQELYES
jgi:hypothetical protein